MATHERVWERAPSRRVRPEGLWQPRMTYTLLGIIGGVWILEWIVATQWSAAAFEAIFVIHYEVWLQPWALVTSTLSHALVADGRVYLWHILFNGLFLFFFGPALERIWGPRKFVTWFFIGGAVSGMFQVTASHLLGEGHGALGASGALMMVFGVLVVLMPNQKILIWGIVPVPFWAAAIGFVILDLIGFMTPGDTVGRIAHLSGMALGLYMGWRTKQDMARRGLHLVYG